LIISIWVCGSEREWLWAIRDFMVMLLLKGSVLLFK